MKRRDLEEKKGCSMKAPSEKHIIAFNAISLLDGAVGVNTCISNGEDVPAVGRAREELFKKLHALFDGTVQTIEVMNELFDSIYGPKHRVTNIHKMYVRKLGITHVYIPR